MKKIISLVLAAVMILVLIPFSVLAETSEPEPPRGTVEIWPLSLNPHDTENYYIVSCIDTYVTEVIIPSEYEGWPVKEIGYGAFEFCQSLTSVEIPDSITVIGDSAFELCASLESIEIPNSVTTIGTSAFNSSGLTNVEIPNSVTSIGAYAFAYCYDLRNVVIPSSVTSIGDGAFYSSCITSIEIPASVTEIGERAFRDCGWLDSITVAEGNERYHSEGNCLIETESKILIAGCENSVIPDDGSVTAIEAYAFYECYNLRSIELPDSITTIGEQAFYGCSSLSSISIANSVTSIGDSAFYECDFTIVEIPISVTSIGSMVFENCARLSDICYKGDSQPESWSSDWLGDCEAVVHWGKTEAEWTAEKNAADIEKEFGGETLLFKLSDDGTYYIISKCNPTATEVTIPSEYEGLPVREIGFEAFKGCTNLKTLVWSDSIEMTNEDAFYTTEIESLYVNDLETFCKIAITPGMQNIAYKDGPQPAKLYVKNELVTVLEIPDTIKTITPIFAGIGSITSIIIPDSVTYINGYSFAVMPDLKTVYIPNSVTGTYYELFMFCNNLTDIYCEAESFPEGWHTGWLADCEHATVHWGYKGVAIESVDENALEEGVELNVEKLDNSTVDLPEDIKGENAFVYDITLTKDGKIVQPNGMVKVSIKAPKGIDVKTAKVYHLADDKTLTDMNAIYENGFFVFETDHFSYYVIAQTVDDNSANGDESNPYPVGDINKSGGIDMMDYILLKRNYFGTFAFEEEQLKLGDINKSGDIDMMDYILLKRAYFGTFTIQ